MRQPALFNAQFFREAVDGVAMVAAGCQLSTHPAGTPGSNQATYTDASGATPNSNPIVLDDDGRCNLWLATGVEYLLRLLKPVAEGSGLIREFDNVVAAAATTGVVTSVNGETGAVELTPELIDYTAPALDWFTAANVQDALDQLATRADAPPASSVTVEDADGLYTGTNVEDVLAELGASSLLPARTGAGGMVLALTADGVAAWERRETMYLLATSNGATASRDVVLEPGTWQAVLILHATNQAFAGNPYSANVTQGASIDATTLTATVDFFRSGDSGHLYRVHGTDVAVATVVVAARDTVTMTIDAASTGSGIDHKGSLLILHKTA